jgi:hypothetical protein
MDLCSLFFTKSPMIVSSPDHQLVQYFLDVFEITQKNIKEIESEKEK